MIGVSGSVDRETQSEKLQNFPLLNIFYSLSLLQDKSKKFSLPQPAISLQSGKARVYFVLIGGFLGAGKTSAMVALRRMLVAHGSRVAMVANEQGVGLVDAQRFEREDASGGRTRAITGGCFCCKADDLVATLRELADEEQPNVILAEPVGSCTDLVATVLRPLEQVYAQGYRMAPMSVVVDVTRIADFSAPRSDRADGLVTAFSASVGYIYHKQMEEAEVLVLNKVDLLGKKQRAALVSWIKAEYPQKKVLEVSTKTGYGLTEWWEWLLANEHQTEETMEVDYDLYAKGEALLGWYDAELSVHAVREEFDGNAFLLALAKAVAARLEQEGVSVAHLKMSLARCGVRPGSKEVDYDLAIVQVVKNGTRSELSERLKSNLVVGKLLVNLRAEGPPAILRKTMQECLQSAKVRRVWLEEAVFKPGRPVPVHRIAGSVTSTKRKKEKTV